MTTIASQITSLTVVYSIVYSCTVERKHQSSASLAFVWGIHRDRWIPRTKGQLRGKCFHLMTSSCLIICFGIALRTLCDSYDWVGANEITLKNIGIWIRGIDSSRICNCLKKHEIYCEHIRMCWSLQYDLQVQNTIDINNKKYPSSDMNGLLCFLHIYRYRYQVILINNTVPCPCVMRYGITSGYRQLNAGLWMYFWRMNMRSLQYECVQQWPLTLLH